MRHSKEDLNTVRNSDKPFGNSHILQRDLLGFIPSLHSSLPPRGILFSSATRVAFELVSLFTRGHYFTRASLFIQGRKSSSKLILIWLSSAEFFIVARVLRT